MLGETRLKLWPVAVPDTGAAAPPDGPALRPGELSVTRSAVAVGTATQPVWLGEVQQSGKRRMSAVDWARGLRLGTAGPGTAVLH
jgi:methionyl-tRNA formyltransferase